MRIIFYYLSLQEEKRAAMPKYKARMSNMGPMSNPNMQHMGHHMNQGLLVNTGNILTEKCDFNTLP